MPGASAATSDPPTPGGSTSGGAPSGVPLVLGVDIGGTSVRAQLSDLAGARLGVGRADGGNPNAVGMATAVEHIRTALESALGTVDRGAVAMAVVGAAGFGGQRDPGPAFLAMWSALGLRVPPTIVSDPLVAFAAGTPDRDGTVVVSGTGAAAVGVVDLRTDLVADGIGWLLGDDGSGYWVGREAVRHTVRPARGIPDDPLSLAVTTHLLGHAGDREAIVRHLYAGSPMRLTTLTRVVVGAAEAGNADARRILDDAAALLERSTSAVRGPGLETPVVLSGGMFASAHLRASLSTRLRRHWPGAPIHMATNGAGGAAWLAALALDRESPVSLHAALTRD